MPRPQIDRHAEEVLLGDIVPWAYERSPLIRETWAKAGVTAADIQSMDDFREKVPFIDKDAIRSFRDRHDDPYGGLLCLDFNDPKMRKVFSAIFSTSGTTGDPTPAPYTGRGPSFLVREFWELGCRPGDHFMHCLFTFRGPGIHDTIRGIGATPVFVDHQPADVPQLFRFSRELRPTGWYTLSGPMVLMIEHTAAELGVDLAEAFSSYRGVIFAGEPIGPRARAKVEGWGLELFIQTSLGDVGAATECREHDGAHFWEDTAFVESLEPDGTEAVGDGERGELVSTTLLDKIAPLVRYRSDDLVRVDARTLRVRSHPRPGLAARPQGRRGRRRRPVGAPGRRVGGGRDRRRDVGRALPARAPATRDAAASGTRRLPERGPEGARRPADPGHRRHRRRGRCRPRGRARGERGAAAPGAAAQDPPGDEVVSGRNEGVSAR